MFILTNTDGGARTTFKVGMKNFTGPAFFCFLITKGAEVALTLTGYQSTDSSGTGEKAFTKNVRIQSCLDCAAISSARVQRTEAKAYSTDATSGKEQLVIFEVLPSSLDVANGFDYAYFKTGGDSASNTIKGWVMGGPCNHSGLSLEA